MHTCKAKEEGFARLADLSQDQMPNSPLFFPFSLPHAMPFLKLNFKIKLWASYPLLALTALGSVLVIFCLPLIIPANGDVVAGVLD